MSNDKINWHSHPLTAKTRIDSSYKNTQNVRRFFKKKCGDHFKFDRAFMAWMKESVGVELGEAVKEWNQREQDKGA